MAQNLTEKLHITSNTMKTGALVSALLLTPTTEAFSNSNYSNPVRTQTHLYQDTDNDGLPDSVEQRHTGSTTSLEPNGDIDNDGLTNLEEYRTGSPLDTPQQPSFESNADFEVNRTSEGISFIRTELDATAYDVRGSDVTISTTNDIRTDGSEALSISTIVSRDNLFGGGAVYHLGDIGDGTPNQTYIEGIVGTTKNTWSGYILAGTSDEPINGAFSKYAGAGGSAETRNVSLDADIIRFDGDTSTHLGIGHAQDNTEIYAGYGEVFDIHTYVGSVETGGFGGRGFTRSFPNGNQYTSIQLTANPKGAYGVEADAIASFFGTPQLQPVHIPAHERTGDFILGMNILETESDITASMKTGMRVDVPTIDGLTMFPVAGLTSTNSDINVDYGGSVEYSKDRFSLWGEGYSSGSVELGGSINLY